MKKFITLCTAIVAFASANAQEANYSLYVTANAQEQSYAVSDIQKLTFTNGNLTVEYKNGVKSQTPIVSITKMCFATAPTAIEAVSNDDADLTTGEVYDLTGRRLDVRAEGELPRGIYIKNGKKVLVK